MGGPGVIVSRVNESLFRATLGDREVARAAVAVSDGVWEVYSTVTAPGYEGRGIASTLVRSVLDAAEEAGAQVIPSCWYVDGLMARSSPRYDHLRAGYRPPPATSGDACRIAPVVVPRSAGQG